MTVTEQVTTKRNTTIGALSFIKKEMKFHILERNLKRIKIYAIHPRLSLLLLSRLPQQHASISLTGYSLQQHEEHCVLFLKN